MCEDTTSGVASRSLSADPTVRQLGTVQRAVVKIGTGVLTGAGDFDHSRFAHSIDRISDELASVRDHGVEVLLVSSGAVGVGAHALGFRGPPTLLQERQGCAAVGQSRLMHTYEVAFARHEVVVAQILVSEGDFEDRVRYLNLRTTLRSLLGRGVLPILNENDAVSVAELEFVEGIERRVFGDNDALAAVVASKLDADLLVLLTDVDGVYDGDPGRAGSRRISQLNAEEIGALLSTPRDATASPAETSTWGRGGIEAKLRAARKAATAGCQTVIASGALPGVLSDILAGSDVGSFLPSSRRPSGRRRWIALGAKPAGSVTIDEGARRALVERGASLLAAGVVRVEGTFERGDVVEILTTSGRALGRGVTHCDSVAARHWVDGDRPRGVRNHHALVHRDHLVLENEGREAE